MLRKSLNFLCDQYYNNGKVFDKNWKDIKNIIVMPVKFSSRHSLSYSSKKMKNLLFYILKCFVLSPHFFSFFYH